MDLCCWQRRYLFRQIDEKSILNLVKFVESLDERYQAGGWRLGVVEVAHEIVKIELQN